MTLYENDFGNYFGHGDSRIQLHEFIVYAEISRSLFSDLTSSGSIQYKSHMTSLLRQQYQSMSVDSLRELYGNQKVLKCGPEQLVGGGSSSCYEKVPFPQKCFSGSPVPLLVNSQSTFIDCAEAKSSFFCVSLSICPFSFVPHCLSPGFYFVFINIFLSACFFSPYGNSNIYFFCLFL